MTGIALLVCGVVLVFPLVFTASLRVVAQLRWSWAGSEDIIIQSRAGLDYEFLLEIGNTKFNRSTTSFPISSTGNLPPTDVLSTLLPFDVLHDQSILVSVLARSNWSGDSRWWSPRNRLSSPTLKGHVSHTHNRINSECAGDFYATP